MKARDLISFALQDLLCWGAWRITVANFLTVLVVSALAFAAYGLAIGTKEVGIVQLKRDPAALRLEVGDSVYKGRVTEKAMKNLEEEILSSISDRNAYLGGFPFRVPELDWYREDGRSMIPLKGRTIRLEEGGRDPLMTSMRLRDGGHDFRGPDDEGVVVTPSMLADLGLDPDAAPPKSLAVEVNAVPVEVPVFGVTTKDLPVPLRFVIPEKYERKMLLSEPDPRLKYVYSGPVPADWPTPDEFPDQIAHLFRVWRMEVHEDDVDDQRVFFFRSRDFVQDPENPCPSWSEWRRYVKHFYEQMIAQGYREAPEFLDLDHRGQISQEEVENLPENNDMAAFYFVDVNELELAADACERVKEVHPPNRDAVDRLKSLENRTQAALRMLTIFVVVIGAMACWNLIIIHVMRAAQKVSEAGMLKAMGTSNWLLGKLVFTEAVLVWGPASSLGILLGGVGGMGMARLWYSDAAEARVGFVWSGWTVVYILTCSFAVCLLSAWWATRSWYWSSPAKLLIDD